MDKLKIVGTGVRRSRAALAPAIYFAKDATEQQSGYSCWERWQSPNVPTRKSLKPLFLLCRDSDGISLTLIVRSVVERRTTTFKTRFSNWRSKGHTITVADLRRGQTESGESLLRSPQP